MRNQCNELTYEVNTDSDLHWEEVCTSSTYSLRLLNFQFHNNGYKRNVQSNHVYSIMDRDTVDMLTEYNSSNEINHAHEVTMPKG